MSEAIAFFRANQRPDGVVTGDFAEDDRGVKGALRRLGLLRRGVPVEEVYRGGIWGEEYRRFMDIGPGPVMLPEGVQVHQLAWPSGEPDQAAMDRWAMKNSGALAAPTCRYCKVPRAHARSTCENCGAPYPALELR